MNIRNGIKLILICIVMAGLFVIGLYRLEIDTDIVASLPADDGVLSDAMEIFRNHPLQDQVVIDISIAGDDPDMLVSLSDRVEKQLQRSGLFKRVGMADMQDLLPEMIWHVIDHLPVMFSATELHEQVAPLVTPEKIQARLENIYLKLLNIDGIGQMEMFAKDPLMLKNIVMAKLAYLAPAHTARIYRGKLISADGRHVLVTARPKTSGTDAAFARHMTELTGRLALELNRDVPDENGPHVILTPFGAYRAALDNELIMRRDVKKAIVLATLGISLLLIMAFPRPLIGLLSLLPAFAGVMAALFVFSLLHRSISAMVLGFGGAIVSITVDHSIAYFLFLDRPHQTCGKDASNEIKAIGWVTVLTTVGAFSALHFSGFPILLQLGQFTSLGILFSFIFVHTVFPMIFPTLPAAKKRRIPLRSLGDMLAKGGKYGAVAAIIFACVMAVYAKPEFNVSLRSMNTVTPETRAAENVFEEVWSGSIFNRIFIMNQARSLAELQEKGDRLLTRLEKRFADDTISAGFVPSMLFPGKERQAQNSAAWQTFWTRERIDATVSVLKASANRLGFTQDAFAPFIALISRPYTPEVLSIPEGLFALLGISKKAGGEWVQFSTLTPGKNYAAEPFHSAFSDMGKLFDSAYFSKQMGELLFATFLRMLSIIGISVIVILAVFFLNLKRMLIAILPLIFALVSTLGTMKLIGHPLDIPGLMLSIIVLGMGIDYSLFFVRSYQRYGDMSHPSFSLVRVAVFMAAASTIIGFGVLCTAEHSLLKSAGLTSLLGIGYSLIGAFVILPPVLTYADNKRKP